MNRLSVPLRLAAALLLVVAGAVRGQGEDGIDVHMHLRWSGRSQGGERDFHASASRLIQMMDRAGVARALVMPPPRSPSQANDFPWEALRKAVRAHPDRLALVAGGDVLQPVIEGTDPADVTPAARAKFVAEAEALLDSGAVAFGEMTALHFSFGPGHPFKQVPADHPLFLALAEVAARRDVAIDLHVEAVLEAQPLPEGLQGRSPRNPRRVEATIPALERLLAHEPKARIVWQHVGWDNTGHLTADLVRRLLDAHPNLFCAIKVVRPELEEFRKGVSIVDGELRIRPEWSTLVADHPDRFVIGADEFVPPEEGPRAGGPPSFVDTWSIVPLLPVAVRSKVARENAVRIYHLE